MKYDIIVVGGGHAGCEASYISAYLGNKTLLVTANKNNIADMACNPSIGGTAKGIIVREIDALGGLMGKIADRSHFQIKMLNSGKGPAVRSLRAQADKKIYPNNMIKTLESTENLTILEAMVENIIVKDNKIKGIILNNHEQIFTEALILTTGTYLKSNILIGDTSIEEGPHGEPRSNHLSDNLKKLGFEILRLKTGTPPRIKKDSVDLSKMKEEIGSDGYLTFSYDNEIFYDKDKQKKCYLIYTNDETKQIVLDNLDKSSMYGGYVTGIGPRYCPSIEDKIVRFQDKEKHQLFLEPESEFIDEWYLQGFSTSMPKNVQENMVHSLPGLENAIITKYAYAIEYDAIDPLQIKSNLESKLINNLFTAGQINGTSGYEEAAAQGLMAGINANLKLKNQEPFILKRSDAYIGVLIDDLITKGTKEPYRMLTSRAEFRLILRHDNADIRLMDKAIGLGTITNETYQKFLQKKKEINELTKLLQTEKLIMNEEIKQLFIAENIEIPTMTLSFEKLLKRPEITISFIEKILSLDYKEEVKEQVEITNKYEGYINKTLKEIEKMIKLEKKQIPKDIDYNKVKNLASEARQKLNAIRPDTIAQANRISGVNPSDISILLVYLKKEYGKDE